jgi:hypothetical protein
VKTFASAADLEKLVYQALMERPAAADGGRPDGTAGLTGQAAEFAAAPGRPAWPPGVRLVRVAVRVPGGTGVGSGPAPVGTGVGQDLGSWPRTPSTK